WSGARRSPQRFDQNQAPRLPSHKAGCRVRRACKFGSLFSTASLANHKYRLAMVQNISKSGISFECQSRLPEEQTVEMILEMPVEISGQPNKHVICRGEVIWAAPSAAETFMVGVAISGYSFLPEKVSQI